MKSSSPTLRQVKWALGPDGTDPAAFTGCLVFDECHKAKNTDATKIAQVVVELQKMLPQARVVYCSATVSEGERGHMSRSASCVLHAALRLLTIYVSLISFNKSTNE